MAKTLTLVRRDDFSADIESISLLDYTNGFQVANDGWEQDIASDDDASVMETMTLIAKGTSHDNLATNLVALDKLLAKAKWYTETPERYALWLRTQLTDESHPREAAIVSSRRGKVSTMSKPASPGNRIKNYPLTLERTPLWEGAKVEISSTDFSSAGGYTDDIATLIGTDPARIIQISLQGTSSVPLTEYWWGFRTARNGTIANFVSPWELESGTIPASVDTALAADNTASPGTGGNTKLNCTFTTVPTMTVRATLTPYQISSTNFEDLRGTFDLILRAKCAAGVTARVQLSCGLAGSSSYKTCGPVTITGTDWKFYNIGRVTLPAGGKGNATTTAMRKTTLRIAAEWVVGSTGADALDLDCLVPIPVDESFGHIAGTSGYKIHVFISPLGHISGYEEDSSGYLNAIPTADIDPATCSLPVGANIMICAAQRVASSVGTDGITIGGYIAPRWRTLRGDDA